MFVAHARKLALAVAAVACAQGALVAAPAAARVVVDGPRAKAAAAEPAGFTVRHATTEGYAVPVTLLPSLPPTAENLAKARHVVELLDSHAHGRELARLKVTMGPLAEIAQICGGAGADACYYPADDREFVADGNTPGSPYPLDYVITHEYGHHIESHRRNDPWLAASWGPKYWASHEGVCDGVAAGRFFPGDQGGRYWDNPAENFADAYALMHYPLLAGAWQYNRELRPTAASFAAIRRDVLRGWNGPRTRRFTAVLGERRSRRTFALPLGLDGTVTARLRSPAGGDFDVALLGNGRVVSVPGIDGPSERLSGEMCGFRPGGDRAALRVVRRSGAGRFVLTVSYPG
jgi:hypothetical protein